MQHRRCGSPCQSVRNLGRGAAGAGGTERSIWRVNASSEILCECARMSTLPSTPAACDEARRRRSGGAWQRGVAGGVHGARARRGSRARHHAQQLAALTAAARSHPDEKPVLEQRHLALARRDALHHMALALVAFPRENAGVGLCIPRFVHLEAQRVIGARTARRAVGTSQQGAHGGSEPCNVPGPARPPTLALWKDALQTKAHTALALLRAVHALAFDLGSAAAEAAPGTRRPPTLLVDARLQGAQRHGPTKYASRRRFAPETVKYDVLELYRSYNCISARYEKRY